jgi:hypothetical protein
MTISDDGNLLVNSSSYQRIKGDHPTTRIRGADH